MSGRTGGVKVFSLSICLLFTQTVNASSPPVPVGEKTAPNPEPFSRRISLPSLKLLSVGSRQPVAFEPKSWRFSFVCVVATWNKNTQAIHDYYMKHQNFFSRYKIATVAAFSHDTPENLAAWSSQFKPTYIFGIAQTEFVDKLNNPKLPTCWLLSREGQILMKHETPTDPVLNTVYDKLKQWTDF